MIEHLQIARSSKRTFVTWLRRGLDLLLRGNGYKLGGINVVTAQIHFTYHLKFQSARLQYMTVTVVKLSCIRGLKTMILSFRRL